MAGAGLIATIGLAVGAGLTGRLALPGNTSGGPALPPRYVEETATAGISQSFDGPLAYFVGGGVATFDCNGDGRDDVYIAGGVNPAALYRNVSTPGGDLRFSALPSPVTDLTAVEGAYPLDIDGDGIVDLAILRAGQNILLRGLGDCRFEVANASWGYDGGGQPSTAFAASWEGSARLPTLAFGNYVNPASVDPHRLCFDNELVRPAAPGDRYGAPIPLTPSWCALSMQFSDWDRSGRRDLRVSNDDHYYLGGQEQLWRIEPGVAPRLYTAADGWATVNVAGMGIATYDLTGDGYPEAYLTSQGSNRLQTLIDGPSQPAYGDIGLKRGVNAEHPYVGDVALPSTAWHPQFEDVNNDGLIDLFVSKGNVRSQPDFAQQDPSNLLIGQPDGTFVEGAQAAGIVSFDRGRGAALADFNLDGLPDLIVVNLGAPVRIWRNVGAGDAATPVPLGSWLTVRIHQAGPNPDAIGSWIETRVGAMIQRREVTVGGGHLSGQLGWIHLGLGAAAAGRGADVRVLWPDGETGPWLPAGPNQFVEIDKGARAVRTWTRGT